MKNKYLICKHLCRMKRNVFALLRTFALVALVPAFSILVGCDPEIGEEAGNGTDTPSDSIVDNTGNGGIPTDSIPGGNGGVPSDSIPGGNGGVPSDSIPGGNGGDNYEGIVSVTRVDEGVTFLEFFADVDLDLLPADGKSVEFGLEITGPDDDSPLRVTTTELGGDVYQVYFGELVPATEYTYRSFATIDGECYYGDGGTISTKVLENKASAYVDEITHNSAAVRASTGYGCSSRETINLGVAWATSESELCAGGAFEHHSMLWSEVEWHDYTYNVVTRIEGLSPNTTYYYTSFTEASGIYVFSTIKSFTTEQYFPTGAVDLGLSVKWAGCNLGAESPEESGGYYAWGETKEKEEYSWATYRYFESDGNEFINEEEMVFIGNNISGTAYDAAHVNLGNGWRMPTQKEVQELIEKCTVEIIRHNDVEGRMITGPNGNSIFLPITAVYQVNSFHKDRCGEYWTGTYNAEAKTQAYALTFNQYSSNIYDGPLLRYKGGCIRPVLE